MSTPSASTWRPVGAFSGIAYSPTWDGLKFLPTDTDAKWLNCLSADSVSQSRSAIDVTVKGDYPFKKQVSGWIEFSIPATMRLIKKTDGTYREDVQFLIDCARSGRPFTVGIIDERKTSKPNGIKIDVIITDNEWTRDLEEGQTYDMTMVAAGTDNAPMNIVAGQLVPIDFYDPTENVGGTEVAQASVRKSGTKPVSEAMA